MKISFSLQNRDSVSGICSLTHSLSCLFGECFLSIFSSKTARQCTHACIYFCFTYQFSLSGIFRFFHCVSFSFVIACKIDNRISKEYFFEGAEQDEDRVQRGTSKIVYNNKSNNNKQQKKKRMQTSAKNVKESTTLSVYPNGIKFRREKRKKTFSPKIIWFMANIFVLLLSILESLLFSNRLLEQNASARALAHSWFIEM